jgi:hypothetical protein
MRPLTATELLKVWEDGIHFTSTGRSLRLLGAACSTTDLDSMADLSIGERDARLLQLREWMFGSRLMNKMNCPLCTEPVEWVTELGDIRLQVPQTGTAPKIFELAVDDLHIRYRLPNSHDLASAAADPSYRSDPRKLLSACILAVNSEQKDLSPQDLPEKVWEELEEQMEKQDPQADIRMVLHCPACAHRWEAHFDIAGYLWTEIDNWARRVMHEVYLLARSFGWSEHDILAMSPRRRQLYIEMLS